MTFVRSGFNFEQNVSLRCVWGSVGPAAPSGTVSLVSSLVTFCLFAVISILLLLSPFSLCMLPLLCVVRVCGRRVCPEGDYDASHVITSCPISRCVGGQTVVQQLSGGHVKLEIED